MYYYFIDDTYTFAETQSSDTTDMLSEILKNIPHKPMKTIGHSFNQIPIPSDSPLPPLPPFKPISSNQPYLSPPSPFDSGHGYSNYHHSSIVNPKAYDAYHTMTMKLSKPQALVSSSLPGPISLSLLADKDFEIQKSIQYELKI
jgi:hypothetical protein